MSSQHKKKRVDVIPRNVILNLRERDVKTKRAATVVARAEIVRLKGVGTGFEMPHQCHTISRAFAERTGGAVVHGFYLDEIRPLGTGWAVGFIYHSIVRTRSGDLVDPNYLPGRAPRFLEDINRPYDYQTGIGWNNIIVTNRPYRCPITKNRIPAWKAATTTKINEQEAFSTDARHFQRKHFAVGDDYSAYVANLGLRPDNAVDICFTTNTEIILVETDDEAPPECIKDYRRSNDTIALPAAITPITQRSVRSEAESRFTETGSERVASGVNRHQDPRPFGLGVRLSLNEAK